LEKIKHGFKTLAECGGIRGVDDTSSLHYNIRIFILFSMGWINQYLTGTSKGVCV
jgi:hypothetical protein